MESPLRVPFICSELLLIFLLASFHPAFPHFFFHFRLFAPFHAQAQCEAIREHLERSWLASDRACRWNVGELTRLAQRSLLARFPMAVTDLAEPSGTPPVPSQDMPQQQQQQQPPQHQQQEHHAQSAGAPSSGAGQGRREAEAQERARRAILTQRQELHAVGNAPLSDMTMNHLTKCVCCLGLVVVFAPLLRPLFAGSVLAPA